MIQGKVGDFVLIIDEEDTCYLKIGKITEVHYNEHESIINTYNIEFNEVTFDTPSNFPQLLVTKPKKFVRAYDGYIFEEYRAKILLFKR